MAKIILSRKGFDSGCGGYASPILPDGTMISFPIPAETNETVSLTYGDLKYKDLPCVDLMKQLKVRKIEKDTNVHLDPDINFSVAERVSKKWEAIFGQSGKYAAPHLSNNGVGNGDIFLFFGWFRRTILTEQGYKFDPTDENGRHVIWGYMEVGNVVEIKEDEKYPEHYLAHPHFEFRKQLNNTAYVAKDKLSFNSNTTGAGVFKFDERLVLSCDPKYRTTWKLPKFFHPDYGTKMTSHLKEFRWSLEDDCCRLKSAPRGQEFIITGNPDVETWAKNIILSH